MRLVLCCFVVLTLLFQSFSVYAEESQSEPEPSPAGVLSLIEIYTWSNTIPRELIDLQNDVDNITDSAGILDQLPDIEKQIEEIAWETTTAKANPNLNYYDLLSLNSKLAKLKPTINAIDTPIAANIQSLDEWYRQWLAKETELQRVRQEAEKQPNLNDSLPTIDSLAQVIQLAKDLIEKQMRSNLLAGQQIGTIQTKVYALNDTVSDLVKDLNEQGIQQTAPSMFSLAFYEKLDTLLLQKGWQKLHLFAIYQQSYIKKNLNSIALSLCGLLLLVWCVRLSQSLVTASNKWQTFANRPTATAIFIFCTTLSILDILKINITLPPDWMTLLKIPLIAAVGRLSELIFKTQWQNRLLKQLLLFLAITLFFTVISLPQPLFYLFVFYSSVSLSVYYLYLFVRHARQPSGRTISRTVLLWFLFPLSIVVAGVYGYDQLASLLFTRILTFILASLTIWLMMLFISGLLELILIFVPVKIIRQNAALIVKQLTPALILVHLLIWLMTALTLFYVHPTLNSAFESITSLKFDIYSFTITPGSVLGFVFIGYMTLLCSRGIRVFLLQDVLPRYRVEMGTQISITRLVHYAVLTIGFIILLRVLGFGLSQITILGGALGVGIGFGLQAIVNNFVSGLILLFERPIKVGDMIEIGEDIGQVKELGLRATTVQTFDNAEIVVPNSQLITGSVTNWTLAEKRIRLKAPVGVAYGSDIETVLKILLSCAEANPLVMSKPKAEALFLAFGSSSLDFELRVWVADFSDRLTLLSELNQDIENEFQLAGIVIPFPQSDLHLRTVDQDITAVLDKFSQGTASLPSDS